MEDVVIAGGMFVLLFKLYTELRRRPRRYKVRPINRRRKILGFYNTMFLPMMEKDPQQFFKYTRMTTTSFRKLVEYIRPTFQFKCKMNDCILLEERVALTLHFLSQGSSMQTIAWKYHMGLTTVHKIIKETCSAIWERLSPDYLSPPSTENEWSKIAMEYYHKWNFPHCLGALDGKHIFIQAPPNSGSLFFNYKQSFSIVLLACADANYQFTLVDVGAYGSQSDGGIFKASTFGHSLDEYQLGVPPARHLPQSDITMPFFLVADEAFPLKRYIMRPYPGRMLDMRRRIFNYRLSRARRIIENTFGILAARWRILKTTIIGDIANIDNIVKATVVLHNFVQRENGKLYCPKGYVDSDDVDNGEWRQEVEALRSVGRLAANNASNEVYGLRDTLSSYFLSPVGELPWQYRKVQAGRRPE